jgi:hypothetical protein
MAALQDQLKAVVLRAAASRHGEWFERCWPRQEAPLRLTAFRAAFAGCGRRLGDDLPELEAGERETFVEAGVMFPERWSLSEFGRAALLIQAFSLLGEDEHLAFVTELYRRGDNREQCAVLKILTLAPNAARFAELAIDACRTNVLDVFEAISCENGYPAAHFPELNFNQLCMKALFMGVSLNRIQGMADRRTPKLSRMATDYASERRAAGRSVPDDIALLVD